MGVRGVDLLVPAKLWEKLNEFEGKTGVKKEDIIMKAIVDIIEGVKCPHCGNTIKVFE